LEELLTTDKEEMAQYADFLMRKEFYQAALDIFTTLADNEFDEALASIWQKIGFCHQKLNHTEETIHAYTVANSIKPNSKWTLSHLASLCYSTGRMEDAAKYYQELLEINPESLKYLMNAAQSLMQCNEHEAALPLLYKASFLDEESTLVKLLLAWCLIVCGKKDDAMKFIFELQRVETASEDANILMGIVLLLDGKVKEAYQQLRPIVSEKNMADLRQKLDTLHHRKLIERTTLTLFTDALTLNID